MDVKRLKQLIRYMRALPKEADAHFNMNWWVKENKAPKDACPIVSDKKRLMRCGTTACALGWAGTHKVFKSEGLIVRVGLSDIDFGEISNSLIGRTFFGLDRQQFDDIFGGSNMDDTPKQWAKRVSKYLTENA